MSFDLNNPPSSPPPDCLDPDKWRDAYREYARHRPNEFGKCQDKQCRERFPCFGHHLALRALIEACTPKQPHQVLPGPGRIVTNALCRWCHMPIEQHTIWGWLHVDGGFILCQQPKPGSPPLTVAEPG